MDRDIRRTLDDVAGAMVGAVLLICSAAVLGGVLLAVATLVALSPAVPK